MVKHVFVITGGRVEREWLMNIWPSLFQKEEEKIVIAADKGLLYAKNAGIPVDKILGDFDSLPPGILEEYEKKMFNHSRRRIKSGIRLLLYQRKIWKHGAGTNNYCRPGIRRS